MNTLGNLTCKSTPCLSCSLLLTWLYSKPFIEYWDASLTNFSQQFLQTIRLNYLCKTCSFLSRFLIPNIRLRPLAWNILIFERKGYSLNHLLHSLFLTRWQCHSKHKDESNFSLFTRQFDKTFKFNSILELLHFSFLA